MNALPQSRRLVLESGTARNSVNNLVTKTQWEFLYTIPASGPVAADEFAWRIDAQHSFHYFECTNYPIQYCLVVGPSCNDWLFRVSSEMPFLDVDDLINAFDRAATVEEKEITTFALGLAAGEADEEEIYQRIRSRFDDPLPRLQLATIEAAFVTKWPSFRSDLERLAATTQDPIVRDFAQRALDGFE